VDTPIFFKLVHTECRNVGLTFSILLQSRLEYKKGTLAKRSDNELFLGNLFWLWKGVLIIVSYIIIKNDYDTF